MLTASESDESTAPAAGAAVERRLLVVALVIGLLIVAASLIRHDGDIAGLIKFGAGGSVAERTAHVEDVLGREVATVDLLGHDGSMFFLQALDPFFVNPDEHAVHLDRPVYRAQRMLFPTVAGGLGLLPAEAVLWSMAMLNVAAIALGSLGTSRIAQRLGGSAWLGLAFALNPGVIFEFDISGAGILAFACAVWGTLAVMDGRTRAAVLWFCAAVLAREVMLLYLAGVCCHQLWTNRRIPWLLGGIPALTAAAWAGYIRLRLDSHDGVQEVQEFGVPFGGILDASENWFGDPVQLGVIAGLIVVMPLLLVRAFQRPNPMAWGALGFVLLAILMTRQVWWNFFDISRAIAPVMTAYLVTAFTEPPRTRDAAASPS
ncbi:MAG: hypothetical protein AAF081_12295 [Actinomycetota bacterium]